jgi:hypothetical protein
VENQSPIPSKYLSSVERAAYAKVGYPFVVIGAATLIIVSCAHAEGLIGSLTFYFFAGFATTSLLLPPGLLALRASGLIPGSRRALGKTVWRGSPFPRVEVESSFIRDPRKK